MPTSALSILAVPAPAHPASGFASFAPGFRIEAQATGMVIVLRLAGADGADLDEASAVAVLADLFRAGWQEDARSASEPVLAEGGVARGFRLERSGTLLSQPGAWVVEGLAFCPLDLPFAWSEAAWVLDRFHRTFFPLPD
jgi:hypothetical protein